MGDAACVAVPITFGDEPPLLGVLTLPPGGPASSRGVLVCSPFGHQNICSYRPLRTLAQRVAEAGLPVLRFDWPGCGDSGDPAPGSPALPGWLQAIEGACEQLLGLGVEEIVIVGLKIGATLGLLGAAAESGASSAVSGLALLAPRPTGRAYLRELRALEALAAQTVYTEPAAQPPPLPAGALETGGFLVRREEVQALEGIDLATADLPRVPGRTLIVSPLADAGTKALADRLADAGSDVAMHVQPELARLWDSSQLAYLPSVCGRTLVDWLLDGAEAAQAAHETSRRPAKLVLAGGAVREHAQTLDGERGRLFGVTSTPRTPQRAGDWVVFLNTGRIRRVGTNRLATTWARRWALAGLPSLRLDALGVGDSDGDTMGDERYVDDASRFYRRELLDDIGSFLDWLAAEHGARRFALVGLSSGATLAFETALRDERVAGVGMINPPAFVWDDTLLCVEAWADARLAPEPLTLLRMLRGRGGRWAWRAFRGALLQIWDGPSTRRQAEAVLSGLARLRPAGTGVTAVYSEGDVGLRHLERALGTGWRARLEALGVDVEVVRGPDHTFRPLWSHDLLRARFEQLLSSIGFLAETRQLQPEAVR